MTQWEYPSSTSHPIADGYPAEEILASHTPPGRGATGRRIALSVGLVVLAVLTGLGIAVAGASIAAPTTTPEPTGAPASGASATPAAIEDPYFHGNLRTLLLTKPTAATWLPDGRVSAVSLTEAVDFGAGTSTYLTDLGFVQGARMGWRQGSALSADFLLYQFGSEAKAFEWMSNQRETSETAPLFGVRASIPMLAIGRYFVVAEPIDGNWFILALFSKNDIAARIVIVTPDQPQPEKIVALAQQQYALLP